GLAGLAAAVGLANKDLDVTLIESRPRLGGRASSFPDPTSGELVDNCQHVSMACCTTLADFCRRVGTADLFRREPGVLFLSPEGKYSTLQAGPLPAPLHLSGSFLRANYLTLIERHWARVLVSALNERLDRMDVGHARKVFVDGFLRHREGSRMELPLVPL